MLARAPSSAAKTRLAADVGATTAELLYRAMLADLFANLAPAEQRLVAYVTGDTGAFRDASGWRGPLRRQVDGDLGRRIAAAIEGCRSDGDAGVLVIDSDAPQVDAALVAAAAALLTSCDVVVGPAVDGGFYLLGVATSVDIGPLLRDIEWGAATVLASLRANAGSAGLAVRSLDTLSDLDRAVDVRRFVRTDQARTCPNVCAIADRL